MANPWTALPKRSPYVLPMDREAVEAYERRLSNLSGERQEQFRLHTDLLPTPFIGDPSAPIVLLSRNPSFNPKDKNDYCEDEFRQAAIQNLTHEVAGLPFFAIESRFRHTASYQWWRSKLKMIEDTDEDTVARGVFCVQAFPYHSWHGFPSKIPVLPSQKYTNKLLKKTLDRGAFVVGMYNQAHWEATVPQLQNHQKTYWLKQPRGGRVSRGNVNHYDSLVVALKRWSRSKRSEPITTPRTARTTQTTPR